VEGEKIPVVRFQQTITANQSLNIDLSPFDRFGGGGGRIRAKATLPAGTTPSNVTMTVLVGSDVLQDAGPLPAEAIAGEGPIESTAGVAGIGAPGDPITVRLAETAGTASTIVLGVVDIQNA